MKILVIFGILGLLVVGGAEKDLYKILGVKKSATTKEIKQAYRRKARDTHPDKNRDTPAEEAAEAFRQVVNAFEILSDEGSRKHYDRTGRVNTQTNSNGGGSRQQYSRQWNWNVRYKPRALKDQFNVQQAQSRVLHVVSLAQLETIMLDDDMVLERNLLICFTTPKTEKRADDDMVFPYPFAHMSSQGIWWEDLMQTVRAKFYRGSELSKFFNVSAEDANQTPVILFLKRGTELTKENAKRAPRILTKDRSKYEMWVWEQIQIQVHFENSHDHPVELYWIHGSRAHKKEVIEVGGTSIHTTMLSHEWYVRDARVDTRKDSPGRHKLTENSSLGSWKILNDTSPQTILIPKIVCFDLSGHCAFWQSRNECRKNPVFMREVCEKTCSFCKQVREEL